MRRRRLFLWLCSTSCASLLICCPWSSAAWCRYSCLSPSFSLCFSVFFKAACKPYNKNVVYVMRTQKVLDPEHRALVIFSSKTQEIVVCLILNYDHKTYCFFRLVCLWNVCVYFCPMKSWMKTVWTGQPSLDVSSVIHKQFKSTKDPMCCVLCCAFSRMLCNIWLSKLCSPQTVSTDAGGKGLYERVAQLFDESVGLKSSHVFWCSLKRLHCCFLLIQLLTALGLRTELSAGLKATPLLWRGNIILQVLYGTMNSILFNVIEY